jgi:hypothetical protein
MNVDQGERAAYYIGTVAGSSMDSGSDVSGSEPCSEAEGSGWEGYGGWNDGESEESEAESVRSVRTTGKGKGKARKGSKRPRHE